MLKRKIEQTLAEWKRTKTKQGILITGARQTGKTSSIERFAADNYKNLIKIDFVERPEAINVITQATSLDDLIMRVTAFASSPLIDGKTLLFFDEVQRCGDAITWMRYLAQDERFDVAYSGSMLGIEAYDFRSLPVGTIDIAEMFPLDFEEFCWANGVDDSLWEIVESCYRDEQPVPDFIHNRFSDLFWLYVLVGGMPEAVQVFVDTHDTQAMRARQNSILNAYRADITRYINDPVRSQRVKTIFNSIPAQLNKENRRFIVAGIDKKKRFENIASDFDWLANAGVALPVKRATEAQFPLGMSVESSFFKLYLNDVGLLFSTFTPIDVEKLLLKSEEINWGWAFENVVAQELRAHGRDSLFYFNNKKMGEVDFLIEDCRSPKVIPVEVKSGKHSHSHAALDRLMKVENYHLERAIVLHRLNVERTEQIIYLPVYMAAFL